MSTSTFNWFGTDGIRAVVGESPLTQPGIVRIGRALARFAHDHTGNPRPRVLLAGDPRESTPEIIAGLSGALAAEGAHVLEMGVVPTPALAWSMAHGQFDLGLMVSASHNPPDYNGIKAFVGDGRKLARSEEEQIEELLGVVPETAEAQTPPRDMKARGTYVRATTDWLAKGGRLDGMHLVVDLAAGAASTTAPEILRALGATVELLHPAGEHIINDACGTEHPAAWLARMQAVEAHAGLAFDGDADRILIGAPTGELLDGDDILAILSEDAHQTGGLPGGIVVSTVMSNLGLEDRLADFDARLLRTGVGDRQVASLMRETGAAFGAEPSGHVILARDDLPGRPPVLIGDAVVAGVRVLQAVKRLGKSLPALRAARPRYPQLLVGVRVTEKRPIAEWREVHDEILRQEARLAGNGRLVIRYSGTEPVLRIMGEGKDATLVEEAVGAIEAAVKRAL